jgi:transposase-like protein
MIKIRKSYTVEQKMRIIADANASNVKSATELHRIDPSMIYRWIKMEQKLIDAPKKKTRKIGCGRTVQHSVEEVQLFHDLVSDRSNGLAVSCTDLRDRMLALTAATDADFKASSGWVKGFMRRFNLSLRQATTFIKRIPYAGGHPQLTLGDKIKSFHAFLEQQIDATPAQDSTTATIWNMDETPIYFDMPANRTVEIKGTGRVPILTTGNERKRATVVLCCSNKGDKMPMHIVVRGEGKAHVLNGVVVRYQERAWMTSDLTERWLKSTYLPFRKSASDILVMDSFSGHISRRVKQFCREKSARIAVIPGGCTAHLQPLDISVNRSFKAGVRAKWKAWLTSKFASLSADANRLNAMSLDELTRTLGAVWNKMSPQVIINGFRKAEIP